MRFAIHLLPIRNILQMPWIMFSPSILFQLYCEHIVSAWEISIVDYVYSEQQMASAISSIEWIGHCLGSKRIKI